MCVCVCAFTHICSHVCVSTIPACKLVWTGHCIKKSITFMCCYSIKQLTLFCTKSLKLRGTVMAPALRIEGWNNKHKLWSICLRTGVLSKCWYAFEHGHMDCNMHEELLWEQTDRDVTVKCLIMSSRFQTFSTYLILIYFSIVIWFWSTSPFSSDSDPTQGDGQWKSCKPILRIL